MNTLRFDFSGARVLVTGGSNGIGLGIASAFAAAGASVTITGADTATGIWAMVDEVSLGAGFRGFGHYHEEYQKHAGRWRIRRLKLTRLAVIPL